MGESRRRRSLVNLLLEVTEDELTALENEAADEIIKLKGETEKEAIDDPQKVLDDDEVNEWIRRAVSNVMNLHD